MSNVSGIGDAYYWSVFKIAEAFGLHRDTVKKRLLAANTPVAATVRGNPVYALQHVGPALFSVKHEAADSVHDPSRMELKWSTKTGHRVRVFPVSIFRFVWG
ncbi:putative terminase small subunit [Escherichia coli]|nr:putative terminase small subunit [Escherichia coli]